MRIRSVLSFHLIHPNVQEPFFYLANEWHKVHGEQAASMAEIAWRAAKYSRLYWRSNGIGRNRFCSKDLRQCRVAYIPFSFCMSHEYKSHVAVHIIVASAALIKWVILQLAHLCVTKWLIIEWYQLVFEKEVNWMMDIPLISVRSRH